MKAAVILEHDVAHGHPLIWVAEIVAIEGRRLWPSAFTSLGQAQVFFNPYLEGPSWQKRDDGWVGEIRQFHQKMLKGHTVLIHNLLVLKELPSDSPLAVLSAMGKVQPKSTAQS